MCACTSNTTWQLGIFGRQEDICSSLQHCLTSTQSCRQYKELNPWQLATAPAFRGYRAPGIELLLCNGDTACVDTWHQTQGFAAVRVESRATQYRISRIFVSTAAAVAAAEEAEAVYKPGDQLNSQLVALVLLCSVGRSILSSRCLTVDYNKNIG